MRTILVVMTVSTVFGCGARRNADESRSSDELARARLALVDTASARLSKRPSEPPPSVQLPFELYTWQVRSSPDRTRQIVILGRYLQAARALTIDSIRVALTPAPDGRSAAGPYPEGARAERPIVVEVGTYRAELPEPFSPAKARDELPHIVACRYRWDQLRAPERVPEVGGREVRALRFDCTVTAFEPRNAPVTVFFGSYAVPNTEITEGARQISGVVYHPERLQVGMPVMIDFGTGLRALAPEPLSLP